MIKRCNKNICVNASHLLIDTKVNYTVKTSIIFEDNCKMSSMQNKNVEWFALFCAVGTRWKGYLYVSIHISKALLKSHSR